MGMIGNQPANNFLAVTKDTFNGNASSYTLSKAATTNGVAVYVENVRQIPTTAYSVSGTTLTFTGTTPAGTGNVYVLHHNTPASTATHPAAQALTATSGTFTGAFTSPGIDDNADLTTITLDANEDITASNGMYVSGDLTSLVVDKGGIDRSGNTTRIISGRSGGNYADFSVNIAGVGGVNRQLYMDYQGNTTLDNGNLVIGTSGKGISFAATSDGGASTPDELLDDYEEGTWTPGLAALGTAGSTINYADYTKIGRVVHIACAITFVSNSDTSPIQLTNLPFNGNNGKIQALPAPYTSYTANPLIPIIQGTTIYIGRNNYTHDLTYADVSGKFVRMSGTYQVL